MKEKLNKLSYLSERGYKNENDVYEEQILKEDAEFWKRLFGEDFYKRVLLNKRNITQYLASQPIRKLYIADYIQDIFKFAAQKYEWHQLYVADNENFLSEWVDKTISELYQRNQQCSLQKEFYSQAARDLETRLESVYIRVLIAEMHILLEDQKLLGKDAIEKYQYFVKKYISQPEYVHKVMSLYPGLHRAILNELYQFFMFYQEFINNYFTSEQQLKIYFGIKEESGISLARSGISDLHNHGKSVLIIEFTGGEKLVYKPRTGANEIVFYSILNNFYSQCGLTGREYKVLDQTECCWCEYLQQEACRDVSQIKRYYTRIGILLFTAYMFGAGDIHEENLIACGEFPMAVDLEVLTRQNVYHAGLIEWKIQSSVMYTGILPVFHWGKHGKGIYAGALGDVKSERQLPFQVPVVVDRKSTDMRIVYTSRIHAGRACCDGAGGDFCAYKDEIIKGYQDAYNYAIHAKEELQVMVVNMAISIKNRILYEDTQKYFMLLQSSFHPDLMLDAADREIYLEKIREGSKIKKEGIIQQEILAMLGRDIPLFYQKADEKAVRINEVIADEALELESPIETIHKNISELSAADRAWQTYLIRLSMDLYKLNTQDLMNKGIKKNEIQGAIANNDMTPESYIEKLYAKIVAMLIYKDGDIGWIDPKIIGDHWVVQKNNEYFYSGTAGMFFLYHCLMLSGEVQADPLIMQALEEKMIRYTMENRNQMQTAEQKKAGIFEGEFSIVYAYLLVFRLTGNFKYLELAKVHADAVQNDGQGCKCFDMLEGKAGSVMGSLLLYEVSGEQKYLENAEEIACQIADAGIRTEEGIAWPSVQGGKALLGLSHGNAGIAWMFSKVYFHTKKDLFQTMAKEAVRYENANYDTRRNDWKDFRYAQHTQDTPISWCHGAGGILLSRKNIIQNCTDQELISVCKADIQNNIQNVMERKLRKGMCMCHGTAGNYEIVRACLGSKSMKETLRAKDIDKMLLQERIIPGFMTGLGGICYGYLRELHPEWPNVLNLES